MMDRSSTSSSMAVVMATFWNASTLKSVSSSPNGSDMLTPMDCKPIMMPEMTLNTVKEIAMPQTERSFSSMTSTREYETMLSEESRSSLVAWK